MDNHEECDVQRAYVILDFPNYNDIHVHPSPQPDLKIRRGKVTKNDQKDPDQQFFEGCTHDLDKNRQGDCLASSASIVAMAMTS